MTSKTTISRTFATKALAAVLAGAIVLPSVTTSAEAGHRHGWRNNHGHHHNHRPRHGRRHDNDAGAAVAAGVIGLAAGAILGSALSQPREYIDPPRPVYAPPRGPAYGNYGGPVVVDYSPRPWTPEWYRYCSGKYRSFEPETGLYTTYSGVRKLCQ
ncbi:BA14K family protein [Stappia sp. GBMRC 2046]|uniref:Lectin-like protein BA14k n=1 Tax=Stappia sediminis TaxID=2692190 RepID=A0A7X3LQZ2_9HYPH|nr:BA14K family protein [Stappia sediminis]MXN63487.1 BA14K family protein [Stappia sediminis]